MHKILLLPLLLIVYGAFHFPAEAVAGVTLDRVKARGKVRCGVSDGIPGFSLNEADGRWTGIDVDFCRAVAAAVLLDPEKVDFVPLSASARFGALKASEIDILARNTTWTLEREAVLEVLFAGALYYDGQSFLVPAKNNVQEISQLNGATICMVKGTTHEAHLEERFRASGWSYRPMIVDSHAKAAEALFSGQCQAFTSEHAPLRELQIKAPGGPEEYLILSERISKEPLGPVVRRGDDEWFTIVRWLLFTLVRAEEIGFTRSNARSRLGDHGDSDAQRWHELDGLVSKALAIPSGWAQRAVASVGNYGEIFDRNLGAESPLKLDRGLNRLWSEGGLMYSPPFR